MLTTSDFQASARRAVDWLVHHAAVKKAVIAVVDAESSSLLIVADYGVSSSVIAEFSLTRDDTTHPLIRAMARPEPTYFDGVGDHHRAPIEGVPFHASPLRGDGTNISHGLLLTGATGPDLHPEIAWLARTLARQMARLLNSQTLANTRFGQERMLLYSIINAVTDPILLTDVEGKLIIANTHAEKLFAAPEDAGEGWRRAAGLNNMLFSAALSTSAVGPNEMARRELLLVDPLEGSDLLFELLSSRATDERQGTYVVSILRNVTDLA